jgi:TetR/AcrR family transcriptional regulator, acrAB operon repressor
MVRRTKEDAQVTRDRLLDAAEQVFSRRGVSGTSLNEVAAAAGVTRGAVYWHFLDKAALFNAMMERVTLPLEQELAVENPGDPLGTLKERFVGALKKTVDDPQTRRVFEIATNKVEYVDELRAVRERHLGVRDNCMKIGANRLSEAQRLGQIKLAIPVRSAAIGLHALIDGLIRNWMLDPDAFDLVKVGRQVLDSYLAGLDVTAQAKAHLATRPKAPAAKRKTVKVAA